MDVMGIVAGLSAATKAAKDLKEIHEIAASAEAKLKLATIVDALADAKLAIANYKEENLALKEEINNFRNTSAEISSLKRVDVLYFSEKDNLYKCPTCVEVRRSVLTLVEKSGMPSRVVCHNCKADFPNPAHDRRLPRQQFANRNRLNDFSL